MIQSRALILRVRSEHQCRRCKDATGERVRFKVFGKVLVFGGGDGGLAFAQVVLSCKTCGALTKTLSQKEVPPIFGQRTK